MTEKDRCNLGKFEARVWSHSHFRIFREDSGYRCSDFYGEEKGKGNVSFDQDEKVKNLKRSLQQTDNKLRSQDQDKNNKNRVHKISLGTGEGLV